MDSLSWLVWEETWSALRGYRLFGTLSGQSGVQTGRYSVAVALVLLRGLVQLKLQFGTFATCFADPDAWHLRIPLLNAPRPPLCAK